MNIEFAKTIMNNNENNKKDNESRSTSKNLYSDAVGSTIRECASNALDSHRRACVDKPIVVSFRVNHETNNYEFSVEDFGTGLNDDDVKRNIDLSK